MLFCLVSVLMSTSWLISLEAFRHLPQQRRLSKEVNDEAVTLLELKANKKMIQQLLCHETGKVILLKDLSNIFTANKLEWKV